MLGVRERDGAFGAVEGLEIFEVDLALAEEIGLLDLVPVLHLDGEVCADVRCLWLSSASAFGKVREGTYDVDDEVLVPCLVERLLLGLRLEDLLAVERENGVRVRLACRYR